MQRNTSVARVGRESGYQKNRQVHSGRSKPGVQGVKRYGFTGHYEPHSMRMA